MSILSGLNARELLNGYAGVFSDGTPKGWNVSRDDRGYAFTLPNGALTHSADLLDEGVWSSVPQKDANSTILWRNSLAFLVRLLEFEQSVQSIESARNVVESFVSWAEVRCAEDPQSMKSGSLDHQGALRIRTLLSIMSMLSRAGNLEAQDEFYRLFTRLMAVEEQLLDKLGLFLPNNHGIMLGIAHLHASIIVPESALSDESGEWVTRLYRTLGQIIDADGIASENTPIYQVFYVALLEDLVSFIIWCGRFPEKLRLFQLLLRSAQIGVRRQLLPNGAVPPLGDSPGGMQHKFKPQLGTLWSPANGLAISSSTSHFLSFIAGFRSVIHKQLDELSVCWWVNGSFILRDAGLLSYDQNDPIALDMRGNKGHSLPTYTRFDSWTTQNVISFGNNSSRLMARLIDKNENSDKTSFTGILAFDGTDVVQRRVESWSDAKLRITDSFLSDQQGLPTTRFIFDPSFSVLENADGKSLTLSNSHRTIRIDIESNESSIEIFSNVKRTFVALEHYKAAETNELILTASRPSVGLEITVTFILV